MTDSIPRAFVTLLVLCLMGCSQSDPANKSTPLQTTTPTSPSVAEPVASEPSRPSVEGYKASGQVIVDGTTYTVNSALTQWEEPHKLQVLLSNSAVDEEFAA